MTDESINKTWYKYTPELLFSLTKKEGNSDTYNTRWTWKEIMLSEKSQSQKDKYHRFHSDEVPRVVKFKDRK